MSHFPVYVVMPVTMDIKGAVEALLAPFDENTSVEPYGRPCHCVGSEAKQEARTAATKELGGIDCFRESFALAHPLPPGVTQFDLSAADGEARSEAWTEHIKPLVDLEHKLYLEHPLSEKPDPSCEECSGTGTRTSCYNPQSKWDWWCIGGRWTGHLAGYDPADDPANYETCWLCQGTGKRNDALGQAERERDPSYGCNGCNGEGKKLKFPTQLKNEGNVTTAGQLLSEWTIEKTPFAVLTSDGEWHERGEMGWFATVSGEKKRGAWEAEVKGLLEAQPKDYMVVVVDCHI